MGKLDPDCPCTIDCPDRPNCKHCERGNAWRNQQIIKQKESYEKRAFSRYKYEQSMQIAKLENRRWRNRKQ